MTTTETTATITWTTNIPVSAAVEYGPTTPGVVVGAAGPLTWQPSITLTGLTANTGYQYRLRSTDGFKNVTRSEMLNFATTGSGGPTGEGGSTTAPMITPVADALFATTTNTTQVTITFSWAEWVGSDGTQQYRWQLATDSTFAVIQDEELSTELTHEVALPVTFAPGVTYFWRVRAETTSVTSPWSTDDSFIVYTYDPWG